MWKLDAMKKYSSHTADIWKKKHARRSTVLTLPRHTTPKRERGSLPLPAQVQGHRTISEHVQGIRRNTLKKDIGFLDQ
jgi:hypothetical protein